MKNKNIVFSGVAAAILLSANANALTIASQEYVTAQLGETKNLNTSADNLVSAINAVEIKVGQKANTSDVYTKTAVDTTLEGYATDSELAAKADADAVYTKTEVDTALGLKADASDVYTKTETDKEITDAVAGMVAGDTGALADALKGKQDALEPDELAAVDSGITEDKVSVYDAAAAAATANTNALVPLTTGADCDAESDMCVLSMNNSGDFSWVEVTPTPAQ